ncbi:MAG: hypothetical protein FWG68_01595 [Defluviitaleaceae bacterium]|nr:hypothetical protein [Defluviitaleaceae bacterium]
MKKEQNPKKVVRNPYYDKLFKNGKAIITIEYEDRDERIEHNVITGEERLLEVIPKNVPIMQVEENLVYN